jgi:hypothetical protein
MRDYSFALPAGLLVTPRLHQLSNPARRTGCEAGTALPQLCLTAQAHRPRQLRLPASIRPSGQQERWLPQSLQSSRSAQHANVVDQCHGYVGQVVVTQDAVVALDVLQVVQADDVDQVIDTQQVLVADGVWVALDQEAGIEDVPDLDAINQGIGLQPGSVSMR